MIGIIGIIIVLADMIAIKKYDKEIRKDRFKKSLIVYSWLLGVALFLVQVSMWIAGV